MVEAKERVGNWDANTIIGKGHSGAVLSLAERASEYTLLERAGKKTASSFGTALLSMLLPLCAPGPHDHGG